MVVLYISKSVVDLDLEVQLLIRNSQIRDSLVHQVYIPCSKYRFPNSFLVLVIKQTSRSDTDSGRT